MNDPNARQGARLLADAMRASGARTTEDLMQQMRNSGSSGDLREWIAQHEDTDLRDLATKVVQELTEEKLAAGEIVKVSDENGGTYRPATATVEGTVPIAVGSTGGGAPFSYRCDGCGSVEHTGDGKAYFYRVVGEELGRWVCWTCVRTPANPRFVRLDPFGNPMPVPGLSPQEEGS